MNYPIVVVVSNCSKTSALDVIANIRNKSNDDSVQKNEGLSLYIHDISTKYYNTQIALCPITHIDDLTQIGKSNVEGFLAYVDPSDREVLSNLTEYVTFIKDYQIEFCMTLCKKLSNDNESGVTFKCIKDCYNMFDIIELEKSDEDYEENNSFNPTGYEELAQALKSVIWSNVDVNQVSSNKINPTSNESQLSGNDSFNVDVDAENELESFENLLNQMMQFRPATSNMSREDRLNSAQSFAEIFEKLIMKDEDLSNLNN